MAREDLSGARTFLPGGGMAVVVKQSEGWSQTETESQDMTKKKGERWREGRVLERGKDSG